MGLERSVESPELLGVLGAAYETGEAREILGCFSGKSALPVCTGDQLLCPLVTVRGRIICVDVDWLTAPT